MQERRQGRHPGLAIPADRKGKGNAAKRSDIHEGLTEAAFLLVNLLLFGLLFYCLYHAAKGFTIAGM